MKKQFVQELEGEFRRNANPANAAGQAAYMKNHFAFWGISSPIRKDIQRPFFLKSYLPAKSEAKEIIRILWAKPQREFHYFAQEFFLKYSNDLEKEDIELMEYMVLNNSWWDTIDFIAPKLMGNYFKKFPELRRKYTEVWIKSGNIWLQRSAILFQLKYKEQLDTQLLSEIINKLSGSDEFFINKAIGWILREYSKTNPRWVLHFVEKNQLSNLSKREAIRLIK
jgi:3-methyladenine DNA glycosylase AlkD